MGIIDKRTLTTDADGHFVITAPINRQVLDELISEHGACTHVVEAVVAQTPLDESKPVGLIVDCAHPERHVLEDGTVEIVFPTYRTNHSPVDDLVAERDAKLRPLRDQAFEAAAARRGADQALLRNKLAIVTDRLDAQARLMDNAYLGEEYAKVQGQIESIMADYDARIAAVPKWRARG